MTLVKLGEFVETQKGFAFKSQWFSKSGHPIVKVSNLTNNSIDVSSLVRISSDLAHEYKRYALHVDDVIVQTVGSWPSNPDSVVGKAVRVHRDAEGALLNQNAVRLRAKSGLEQRFLFYVLCDRHYSNYIVGTAQGAANQAAITLDALRAFEFDLPDIRTQRWVVEILSSYDDLIENNIKRIKILEDMVRLVHREWFVHFRFPGYEKVRMVSSPLGKIPEGWHPSELEALVDDIRDAINPSEVDPTTPYFGLEHLPRRSIALAEWGQATDVQSTKLWVRPMDVLFGKIRPYFHKVGPSPVEGVCSSDAMVLRAQNADEFGLIVAITSSDEFVSQATQTSQGTKMPRSSWDVLRHYPVAIPPKSLLAEFNAFVTANVKLIHSLIFENRNLQATRDLLLPRLISGQVTLPP